MPAHLLSALLLVFAATLGLDWPQAPLNARLPELLFPLVLGAIALNARRRLKWMPLDGMVLLYLAGALPSLAVSTNLRTSLVELGRECYLAVLYGAIAIAVVNGRAATVARGLAIGGAGLATMGLAFVLAQGLHPFQLPSAGEVMSLPYVGPVLRLRAFTASEAMLACLLTTTVPFAIGLSLSATRPRARHLWTAAAIAMGMAAVFTFSHSIAGVTVATVIGGWHWLGERRWLRRAAIAAAAAAILAFNLAATASIKQAGIAGRTVGDSTTYHYGVGAGRLEAGPLRVEYAVMSYWRLKQEALNAFLRHPIAGVGLDGFHDVSEAAYQSGRLTSSYRTIDPHSTLLGRLAETGIVGGVTLIVLWVGLAFAAAGAVRDAATDRWIAIAASAALAGLLANSINVDVMNFRFLWVAAGLIRGIDALAIPARTAITPG